MFLAGLLTVGSTAAAYAQQATTPLRTADPQVGDMPSGAAFLKDSFEAIAELAVWRRASAETAALGETGRCVALLMQRREANRAGKNHEKTMLAKVNPVSYTHLTLPTIYSV